MWWRSTLISLAVLVVLWLAFVAVLALARPDTVTLRQMPRLLPDTIRLVRRLASDRSIPRSARLPVWALLAYLACPIDLVPDFLPIVGYADDAVLTALVLRRLVRHAGHSKVSEQWPGTPEGLTTLRRLLRLEQS